MGRMARPYLIQNRKNLLRITSDLVEWKRFAFTFEPRLRAAC